MVSFSGPLLNTSVATGYSAHCHTHRHCDFQSLSNLLIVSFTTVVLLERSLHCVIKWPLVFFTTAAASILAQFGPKCFSCCLRWINYSNLYPLSQWLLEAMCSSSEAGKKESRTFSIFFLRQTLFLDWVLPLLLLLLLLQLATINHKRRADAGCCNVVICCCYCCWKG